MGRPDRERKAERRKRKDNQQVDFKNMNGLVPRVGNGFCYSSTGEGELG